VQRSPLSAKVIAKQQFVVACTLESRLASFLAAPEHLSWVIESSQPGVRSETNAVEIFLQKKIIFHP
jgi:hypothetical protein